MMRQFIPTHSLNQFMLPDVLLATKLAVPPLRPAHQRVDRPHLIARLNEALDHTPSVTVLSAPPGFGKTTLLTEWVSIQDSFVAWLSLDENDNDSRRFLLYVVAALQNLWPEVGQQVLALLRAQEPQGATLETFLIPLINELTAVGQEFVFVLDDYQAISSPFIHNSLAFLLDNLPPQLHLVVASRAALPVSLGRLRAQGRLVELRTEDLRFRPAEAATFLEQVMDLPLSPAEVAALEERTEGWIAGLQMAALSMQGLTDTAGFVRAFTGSHRHILDYLSEEILYRQPAEIQEFLLHTSILTRMCGPLCDAVMGAAPEPVEGPSLRQAQGTAQGAAKSGQEMLEYLERTNLFVIPLDHERRWYRYHHLMADLLRQRLEEAIGSQGTALLHRRASKWYEQQGLAIEALSHALAAVDVARVVRLAKPRATMLLSHSELVTMLSWLDLLPGELSRSHPQISLFRAWASLLTGQLENVETHLQAAEQQVNPNDSQLLGEIATIRASVAYFRRDMAQAIEIYRQALTHLSPDDLYLRGVVMECLGGAYSWLGQVVEATQAFGEGYTISQAAGNLQVALIALWSIARLHMERGQLRQAAELYQQALRQQAEWLAEGWLSQEHLGPIIGRIHCGLAEVKLQWNELDAAAQHGVTAIKLAEQAQELGLLVSADLLLAQVKQAQGAPQEANKAMQQAEQWLSRRYINTYYLNTEVALAQMHLGLRQGKVAAVIDLLQEQALPLAPPPEVVPYLQEPLYLLWTRVLLAQGWESGQYRMPGVEAPLQLAQLLLGRILAAARASERMFRVVEALSLTALLFQAEGDQAAALAPLKEALVLAEPEGYIRLFLEEGPPMAQLLRQGLNRGLAGQKSYAVQLLAAFEPAAPPEGAASALLEPLSDRELELLGLMASGMSNREIAEKLFLTVGTVKWHLNNVYSKLDVRSRTQAVARARELKLL